LRKGCGAFQNDYYAYLLFVFPVLIASAELDAGKHGSVRMKEAVKARRRLKREKRETNKILQYRVKH
jgi:hypothetical protein